MVDGSNRRGSSQHSRPRRPTDKRLPVFQHLAPQVLPASNPEPFINNADLRSISAAIVIIDIIGINVRLLDANLHSASVAAGSSTRWELVTRAELSG